MTLRDKKKYWELLNMLLALKQIPAPPPVPYARARISAHFYVHNFMDDDNAMIRGKEICDWLKGLYIADDSRKTLTWAGLPEQTIDRKDPRVEITLEEIV